MNRTQLLRAPNPADYSSVMAWQKAVYEWMDYAKGRIESDSNVNTTPVGPLVVSTYTQTATITGTDALSNFVATLVTMLNQKGITAPNISRTTT